MKQEQYLQIKKEVLEGSFIASYVAKELGVTEDVAKCMVEDWQNQDAPVVVKDELVMTESVGGNLKKATYYITELLARSLDIMTSFENKDKSQAVREALHKYIPENYKKMAEERIKQESTL